MRRLATIMFTDIVGYSAMMNQDERGTLELLAQHNAIVQGEIERFGGTTIKTIGDAFLIDFNSVVECVECAFAIQEACAQFNTSRAENQPKLQLRIGIHVGDVVFQENDVFGDGVNVAQRIQSQAEPGSICISEEVFKLIEKKVPIHFRLIGEKKLKNIERPMRVYVSGHPGVPAQQQSYAGPKKSSGWAALLAGCILGLLLVGGILYYYYATSKNMPPASAKSAASIPAPANQPPVPPPPKEVPQPAQAKIAEHVRKNIFTDLARDLTPPEAFAIGAIRSKPAEAEPEGKGRFKIEADVTIEQTQDLFVPYDFQAAVKEMGYNPETYRNALAEAGRIGSDLAATAPKEESPTLIRRTTGKGYDVTVPVEFTAAQDGSDWVFGPIKKRAGSKPPEGLGFKGQPLSAFAPGSLVAGSEPAMQAISAYIQARENFSARVLVKKTQLQVKKEEEDKTQKEKQGAELVSRFTVGELYDGVMVENDKNNYQVIFMVVENKNEGELVTATVALGGEPGILRSLTGRIEVVEKDGKAFAQAVLSAVANSGVVPASGVPEFFYRGKNFQIVFRMNGERIDGSGSPYTFKLNKSKD